MMTRTALITTVAFVAGLGTTSAFAVQRAAAEENPRARAFVSPAPIGYGSAEAAAADQNGRGAADAGAAAPAVRPEHRPHIPADDQAARRLSKIFAAMQPDEAARVLERLDDHEIQLVLLQVGDRKAADILSSFDPERAAGLSRSVILGGSAR